MKISTDNIQGQAINTSKTEYREINTFLEKTSIERCVLHANNETKNIITETCIVMILYGRGILTVGNKVIGCKVNDIVMLKDEKEFTMLNTNNEDLAYIVIC